MHIFERPISTQAAWGFVEEKEQLAQACGVIFYLYCESVNAVSVTATMMCCVLIVAINKSASSTAGDNVPICYSESHFCHTISSSGLQMK